jgi:hypothetical protein
MEHMMSFFKKNKSNWDKPFSERVAKRVAKIPTGELELWTDQAIYELGRCLSGYQKSRDKFYLDEAQSGAEALHAVVEELHKRMR